MCCFLFAFLTQVLLLCYALMLQLTLTTEHDILTPSGAGQMEAVVLVGDENLDGLMFVSLHIDVTCAMLR